jgi:hypothetical protein
LNIAFAPAFVFAAFLKGFSRCKALFTKKKLNLRLRRHT